MPVVTPKQATTPKAAQKNRPKLARGKPIAAGSDPVEFGRFVFSSVAAGSVSPAVDVEIEPRKDFSGSAGVLCCAEGKQLVLPAGSKVSRAFYGDRRALWDENHGHVVTEQVSEAHGYGMMDTSVQEQGATINFNAGLRTFSVLGLAVADYVRAEAPTVCRVRA